VRRVDIADQQIAILCEYNKSGFYNVLILKLNTNHAKHKPQLLASNVNKSDMTDLVDNHLNDSQSATSKEKQKEKLVNQQFLVNVLDH